MKTLAESIDGLNKAVKENREKIDIHKLVVKKFPNSTIEVAQIEDGSQVFYAMKSNLMKPKIIEFIMIGS